MTAFKGIKELDQVLRIAAVGAWEWLPMTDEVHWSKEMLRICGFDTANHDPGLHPARFASLSAHIHPDDRAAWTENVRACLEDGREHAMELRIVRPSGEIRWIQVRGNAERDAAGQVTRLLGIAADVTDRMRAEQQTERFFSTALHLLLIADADGTIRRVNPAWVDLLGWSTEALIGTSFLDLVHPDDLDATRAEAARLASGRNTNGFENRYRTCDGSYRVLTWSAAADPTQGMLYAIAHDVTERRRIEAELRASECRLKEAERIARIGSWHLDVQSDRLLWSNEVFRLFGVAPGAFGASYRAFLDNVHPDDRDLVDQTYRASLANQTAYEVTHRIRLADGEMRWLHERAETRFDPEGRPISSIGTVQDVTEPRLHEEQISLVARRTQALLELPRAAETLDETAFMQRGQELAEDLTGSRVAFIHFVNDDDETIELVTWSHRTLGGYCTAAHDRHYPISSAGIWADAFRKRTPVIFNDYPTYALKRGLPDGHAELQRLISTPVIEHGRVVMLTGVGNKETPYTAFDVETVQLISNEIWHVVQRHRTLARLRLVDRVFKDTAEGVVILTTDGRIVAVNPAFQTITGYTEREVLGQSPSLFCSGRDNGAFYQTLWASLLRNGNWRGEVWNRRKDGGLYPEWLSINAVHDEQGSVTHYVGIFSDISAQKEAQRQIEFLAQHDALTQLPNRILFHDRLDHAAEQARAANTRLALLYIDLDRFKVINETLGHALGDALLREVGRRLTDATPKGDTLARLGGDEFVLLLELRAGPEGATSLAGQIIERLAVPIELDGRELVITTSIGISLYPEDGDDAETLLRYAEQAMYAAKQHGRNNFRFFTQSLNDGAIERMMMEHALRGAVKRDELLVMFQPQVSLTDGTLAGIEALVRWRHPTMGLIPPLRFIGMAEEIGLIGEIDAWVLDTACRQLAHWDAMGFRVPCVAVNLSARELEHDTIVHKVAETLRVTGLAPERLELEITESMLMRDPRRSREVLAQIKALGVRLAMDDFGTGYSNLALLKLLSLDRLKIDQSFIRDIGQDLNNEAIVRAIIALAHSLGLETLAEGVEESHQAEMLSSQGVDIVQGYLYGRPMLADDLEGAWHCSVDKPGRLSRD
jgi:diguanylate cyclase (GGDEF)-like protein/PAS domain S-box-containing protein